MSRYVFVPLSDELLYDHPERIAGPIVPYHPDAPCYHWLSVELNPQDDLPAPPRARAATKARRPMLRLVRSGLSPT